MLSTLKVFLISINMFPIRVAVKEGIGHEIVVHMNQRPPSVNGHQGGAVSLKLYGYRIKRGQSPMTGRVKLLDLITPDIRLMKLHL